MALLEICCYSVECAQAAERAGADRIELCSAPLEGGLTPSMGTLRRVREAMSIPVHPIVRPRNGDFCYSHSEFATLLADVELMAGLGYSGVVTGVLDSEGQIDEMRMAQVISAAGSMSVTFHRAFDMCRDPHTALNTLAKLGITRVLTSGQQPTARAGLELIRELKRQTTSPIIMAGSGIRPDNLALLLEAGIDEVHSSAGHFVASPMRYRNSAISMSGNSEADEYRRYCVNPEAVMAMKQIIRTFDCKE